MKNKRHHLLSLVSLAGVLMICAGISLQSKPDIFASTYNRGLAGYISLQKEDKPIKERLEAVVADFDAVQESYAIWRENRPGRLNEILFPQPDRRIAALAAFHKASLLAAVGDVKNADQSYKDAAALNPGNDFSVGDWGYLKIADSRRLEREALDRAYNHELLLNQNKGQGEGQGKGKGNGKGKDKGKGKGKGKGQQKGDGEGSEKSGKGTKPSKATRRPL